MPDDDDDEGSPRRRYDVARARTVRVVTRVFLLLAGGLGDGACSSVVPGDGPEGAERWVE